MVDDDDLVLDIINSYCESCESSCDKDQYTDYTNQSTILDQYGDYGDYGDYDSIYTIECNECNENECNCSFVSKIMSFCNDDEFENGLSRRGYQIVSTIAIGLKSKVLHCTRPGYNQDFALKVSRCVLSYEYTKLKNLGHPNIIKVYDLFIIQDHYVMVMELVDGDLKNMGDTGYDNMKGIVIGVCRGLEYCHQQGVYHRNINIDNILIKNGVPILIGFGNSTVEKKSLEYIQNPYFTSPECERLKNNILSSGYYSCESNDVWALGILIVKLFYKKFPWKDALISNKEYCTFTCNKNKLFFETQVMGNSNIQSILGAIFCTQSQRCSIKYIKRKLFRKRYSVFKKFRK